MKPIEQRRTSADKTVKLATWLGFGAMCIGMFMAILDVQIVATSLPNIQAALDIEPDRMSWVQTAYLIAEVIAIPLTGLLMRMLTMRWLFVGAIAVFTIASIGCAAANSFGALIGWRIVQGLAGGTLIPAVFAAVFLLFPLKRQAIATTLAGVLAVLAPTIGPVIGGWITETYSWHWLFLINVVPGLLAALIAAAVLKRDVPRFQLLASIDWISLILLAVALAAFEIALKEAPTRGWVSGLIIGLFGLSLSAAIMFTKRSLSRVMPVVDLRNFNDRSFVVGCLLSFVLGIGLFGSVYLMPVFLAFVRGHNALEIGTIMLVTGAAQLVMAPIAVALELRVDARVLTAFGFGVFGVGLALSGFQTPQTDGSDMFWPQIIRGIAIMFCLLPPTRLALGHLSAERVPDASGLFNLMRNLGGAIGLALIDTVIYSRSEMHSANLLADLQSGDASVARFVGVSTEMISALKLGPLNEEMQRLLEPLVENAGFTAAINDAWLVIAGLTFAALLCVPFASPDVKPVRK